MTTVGGGTVPDKDLPGDASFTTTEADGAKFTVGNVVGADSDACSSTGALKRICRGAFVAACGDGVSAARPSVADITGPAEDIVGAYFVNGQAVESRNWIGASAPASDGTCTAPRAELIVLTAPSYDGDSPPDSSPAG